MTTTTQTTTTGTPLDTPLAYAVTPRRVLHAEWHKFRTLRSTWLTLGLAAALVIGVGLVMGSTYDGDDANIDTVLFTLFGSQLSQICVAVLGILISAGEYSTGLVRATMAAVPRRLPVLWAKAGVFTAFAFTFTFVTNTVTFLLAQIWLSDTDKSLSLTDSGVLGALAGNAAGVTLLSVIALGLGALCRSIPAAIGAFVGVVMILPEVLGAISNDVVQSAVKYFPAKSSESLGTITQVAGHNAPLTGLLSLLVWAAVVLGAAALLLKRRDV
ncbi:ABC transporter permease [Streptomyces kunmingensis]|uniref:ABC transporter permease n=1 Tax=Streptomyces kunmingensis TaxID=68225 RepID=A0ABU6CDG4_9ACTN|nr:ABC transporter permease [Streptomyces kunmingensis]MEB3962759.1 ABC transporter permease [Streptomyces kunmingensis]